MKKIIVNEDHYLDGNKKYDRVTSVLNIIKYEGFEKMKDAIGEDNTERMLTNAANRGKQFHEYAAMYAKKKLTNNAWASIKYLNPEIFDMINLYKEWFDANVKKVIFAEKTIVDDILKIGGTIDLFAKLNNDKKYLIDLKATAGIYPNHVMQLAAYQRILRNNEVNEIDGVIIVRVKGKCHVKHLRKDQLKLGYGYFLAALSLYRGLSGLNNIK